MSLEITQDGLVRWLPILFSAASLLLAAAAVLLGRRDRRRSLRVTAVPRLDRGNIDAIEVHYYNEGNRTEEISDVGVEDADGWGMFHKVDDRARKAIAPPDTSDRILIPYQNPTRDEFPRKLSRRARCFVTTRGGKQFKGPVEPLLLWSPMQRAYLEAKEETARKVPPRWQVWRRG